MPWFISGILIRIDTSYYEGLNLPFFAPYPVVFPIIWTILYLLIAYAIGLVIDEADKRYKKVLLVNYLANQLFTVCFFYLKSNILAWLDCLVVFISSIYLYGESKMLNWKSGKYLVPYLIWNGFALILMTAILLMN